MKNRILSFLIVPALLIIGLISGCYYDEVIPDPSIYEEPVVDEDPATFSGDVIPIFNESCNASGCHSPGAVPPDLSAANAYNALFNGGYIDVAKPDQSELYQWVKGNRSTPMPLTGTEPYIYNTILSWIEAGALNN